MSEEKTLIKSNARTTSLDMELGSQENDETLVTSGSDPNDQVLTKPVSSDPNVLANPVSSDPNVQVLTDPASSYAIPRK